MSILEHFVSWSLNWGPIFHNSEWGHKPRLGVHVRLPRAPPPPSPCAPVRPPCAPVPPVPLPYSYATPQLATLLKRLNKRENQFTLSILYKQGDDTKKSDDLRKDRHIWCLSQPHGCCLSVFSQKHVGCNCRQLIHSTPIKVRPLYQRNLPIWRSGRSGHARHQNISNQFRPS